MPNTGFKDVDNTKNVEATVSATGRLHTDTYIQDQTTPAVIAKFNKIEVVTESTKATAIGEYTIEVDDSTGITAGKYLVVYSSETNRYYLGYVLSISVNELTMDTPFDSVFPIGTSVTSGITNMNVNGSTTPQVFGLRGSEVSLAGS